MQQQKSRAFYRIQATRMMIGAGNILKKHAADQARKVRHIMLLVFTSLSFTAQKFSGSEMSLFFVCVFKVVSSNETQAQEDDPHTVRMEFEPSLYQCFENCGSLKLTVARHGGDPGSTVKVRVSKTNYNGVCVRDRNQNKHIRKIYKKGKRENNSFFKLSSLRFLELFLILSDLTHNILTVWRLRASFSSCSVRAGKEIEP